MMPAGSADVEAVFRREYGRAVAVLVRFLGDIDLAEEAVQDAFTKALERWPAGDGGVSLSTRLEKWLQDAHQRLLDDECTVVFTGRDRGSVPQSLIARFDKALVA